MTVQNLVKQGHEVMVATPGKNAPDEYYGAKVVKVPGHKFPLNEFCDSEYIDLYATYCAIKSFKPDIVHVCSPTWIVVSCLLWCWWFRIPLVVCYHTHVPEYIRHYIGGIIGSLLATFLWFLIRVAHNLCTLTMVTSDIMGKELAEHGICNEMAVWRKGVDTSLFHPCKGSAEVRSRLMPDTSKILLLYAGRLSLEKGLPLLAKVLEDRRIRGKVHLVLIGDGPIRKSLDTTTFARVRQHVTFTGFMSQEDLAIAYASSDIFVFPSETETLGLVAIEAMAGGLPVVGVAARGMTATVKHGVTGYLYPPGDINQCVTHLLSLIENAELRTTISKAARKDAEQWGWDEATKQLVKVYEETIEKFKLQKSVKQL
jgi:glycosyltransferase involved in cell wall biosynthesis